MQRHLWRKNLRVLRKKFSKTQSNIASALATTQQVIGNWESKTNPIGTPDLGQLLIITNLFGVSFEDFMNKDFENAEDSSFIEEVIAGKTVGSTAKNYTENDILTIANDAPVSYAPNVLDVEGKATAEILQVLQKADKLRNVPNLYLPNLGPGQHIRIQITGDSMHPRIKDKDIVIATRVPEGPAGLREGHIYVALDKDDGIICRRIYRAGDDQFQMVSDNNDYKPYNRHVQRIEMLFKVQQVHSSDLHKYRQESSREIEKLWKAIEEIRQGKTR